MSNSAVFFVPAARVGARVCLCLFAPDPTRGGRSADRRTCVVVALARRDHPRSVRRGASHDAGRSPLGAPPWRFSAGGRASISGIASGSVQRAPRSQVVMPGGRCPGPPEPAVTSRSRGTPLPAPPSGSSLEDAPPGTRMRIYNPASLRSQRINTHRSRRGVATRGPAPLVRAPRRSRGRCDRSVSHHQDRAFGVAHHVSGVGAEEIGAHGVPMLAVRTHDDQIGLDGVRFFQDLLIDAALAHRR